jgi:CRISPR-associated protein Cas1
MARAASRSRSRFFDRLTSLDQLRAGFDRVAANDGCPGGDGVSIATFRFGLDRRLTWLQQRLRDGSYTPQAIAVIAVDKPGKPEKRILRVPSVVDRVVQSAAAQLLQELLEPSFEPLSFAYRPGRSVKQALAAVRILHDRGYHHVVDADIKAYFDNVPHLPLLSRLALHVNERPFLDLVRAWLESCPTPGRGLPQGAPISPVLANLYLDSLDEDVAAAGFMMIRYADDFVVLCRSAERADEALAILQQRLGALGLELHPEKTAIRRLDEGYAFLGVTFRGTTLARQVEELGELPAVLDAPEETDGAEGSLLVPASRLTNGMEIDGEGKVRADDVRRLERPWDDDEDAEAEAPPDIEDAVERQRFAAYVRTLYIKGVRRELVVRESGFAVVEDGVELGIYPPGTVNRIDLFPGAEAGVEAMRHAARNGIPVFLVNGYGATEAVLGATEVHRAKLHLAQARHVQSDADAIALARQFVAGRVENARRLLLRLRSRFADKSALDEDALDRGNGALEELVRRIALYPRYDTMDALRGDEGQAGAIYWPLLAGLARRGFAERNFKRHRSPPDSPLNAVHNFTAGLLRRDVEVLVRAHGLHPGFGVLHTPDSGKSSCVFDLMEEFRAPIAEALAMLVFATAEVGEPHFYRVAVEGSEAVHISSEGVSRIIRAYERHVNHKVKLPDGAWSTWRGLIDHQVCRYSEHVLGVQAYRSYRMDI